MPVTFRNEEFALHDQPFVWPQPGNALEDAGAELVKELARVGWDVPGIDVEFQTTGQGTNVFRRVSRISGETPEGPFRIRFGNSQERRGRFYALTGLNEAAVPPGVQITFYDDDRTLVANVYAGKDFQRDGAKFISEFKSDPNPKLYRSYKGRVREDELLGSTRDVHIEHKHRHVDGPLSLSVKETVGKVLEFIGGPLMHRLSQMPTAPGFDDVNEFGDANLRRLAKPDLVQAPDDFPVLYAWTKRDEAYRIMGHGHTKEDGSDDYVLSGNGWRLAAFGETTPGAKLHPRVNDGFSYASTDATVRASKPGHWGETDGFPVEIRLRHLNEVFVVDNAVYERTRAALWEKVKADGRDEFNHAEIREAYTAVAKTMVPAAEYDGSYEKPNFLIGRQLHADEARLMRGPIKVHVEKDRVRTIMSDEESGRDIDLCHFTDGEYRKLGHWAVRDAERMAETASDLFRIKVKVVKDHEFPVPPKVDLLKVLEGAGQPDGDAPSSPAP